MNAQLILVTGKGGVGKTFVSVYLQKNNPRFSLAESTNAIARELEKWKLTAPPVYRFSQRDLAEAFLNRTLKLSLISNWIAENKLFQNLLDLAPNLMELLMLEQWMKMSTETPLIIDAPSTGHFLALFDAISGARELFESGSLRAIADELHDFFSSSKQKTQIKIVSLPEHSSLAESMEIESRMKALYPRMEIKHILNRKHEAPQNAPQLPEPWKSLAFVRPTREDNRIQSRHFDEIVVERASLL